MSPMDSTSIGMTVALVILVAMSAYFSATETAFTSLNRIRLKSRADNGDQRAARALALAEDYDKLLSTILIGNNIVNNVATTIGAVLFIRLLDDVRGPTVSAIVLTVVILIFGEVSPKSLAKESPEAWAMLSAPLLRAFVAVLTPANFLFTQWKRLLSLIIHKREEDGITEEELVTMVDQAENEGGLDEHESELIRNAIEFHDLEVSEILTPRVDIVAAEENSTMEEVGSLFAESGYSRLPIYQDSIDNIVGVIHEKDFNAARYRGQGNISGCITPVHYTTANADLGLLLRTLQKKKTHMAIVVDEYGGTEGIATLEDIVEELVGDLETEDEEERPEEIRQISENCWRIQGSAPLDEVEDALKIVLPREDYDTFNGYVWGLIDRIPADGEQFEVQAPGLKIQIKNVKNHMVDWAVAEKLPADPGTPGDGPAVSQDKTGKE